MMKKCTLQQIDVLREISSKTFYETFHDSNDAQTMQTYLNNAFSPKQMEKELLHPHSTFYVYEVDGQVVGYLKLNERDAQTEKMNPDALEIERIYVLKSFQKRGIGKIMLEKAITLAHNRPIWLGVWEKNPNAIAFYEKMGFKKTGEHIFQMGDEQQTDWIMTRFN